MITLVRVLKEWACLPGNMAEAWESGYLGDEIQIHQKDQWNPWPPTLANKQPHSLPSDSIILGTRMPGILSHPHWIFNIFKRTDITEKHREQNLMESNVDTSLVFVIWLVVVVVIFCHTMLQPFISKNI